MPVFIESFTKLTRCVQGLLILYIVVLIIAAGSDFLEFQLLNNLSNGVSIANEQVVSNDSRQALIGIVQTVVLLLTSILFLRWIYRQPLAQPLTFGLARLVVVSVDHLE